MSARRRIGALLRKEAYEIVANRWLMLTIFGVPASVVALTTANVATLSRLPAGGGGLPPKVRALCEPSLSDHLCAEVHLGRSFAVLYLLLPMIIPSAIAAYGIVGEKRARTLEPLLAAPLRTVELLFAKTVAAALPGVVAAWLGYGAWIALTAQLASPLVVRHLTEAPWVLANVALGPPLALLATTVGLMVSSRTTDPRAAQQIASLVILPVVGTIVGQLLGVVTLTVPAVLAAGAGLLAVDGLLLALAVRLFARESILTRWQG